MFEFEDAGEKSKKTSISARLHRSSFFSSKRRIGSDDKDINIEQNLVVESSDETIEDSALYIALLNKQWDECRRLLMLGGRDGARLTSYVHNDGNTPLHEACYENAPVDIVKSIYEVGGDKQATKRNINHSSPLHVACQYASEEVIFFLLDVAPQAATMEDDSGELPLHEALRCEREPSVVKRVFTVNPTAAYAANAEGWTPLEVLIDNGWKWQNEDICSEEESIFSKEMIMGNESITQCQEQCQAQCRCVIS